MTSSNPADALVVIAETFLGAKITAAADPEIYQVIVHVGTDVLPAGTPACAFYQPDGTIGDWHDTEITPDTSA